MKTSAPVLRGLVLATVGLVVGCGSADHSELVRAANDTNIKKAASLYQLYASRFGYVGPKSKEELTTFLTTNDKIERNLKLMGIDRGQIENYFVSENDGEEFDFRWGVFVNPDLERAREPVVFERTGRDGVRLVMLSNRRVLEVTDNRKYEALRNGKVSRDDARSELERAEQTAGADG